MYYELIIVMEVTVVLSNTEYRSVEMSFLNIKPMPSSCAESAVKHINR